MMDSTVKLLLEQTIDTPCKLHMLLLFDDNAQLVATAQQLAERSCRDIWSVTAALRELAEGGVLHAINTGGETVYRYMPRPDKIDAIRKLVRSYDDPFQRDSIQSSVRELEMYASYSRAVGSPQQSAF